MKFEDFKNMLLYRKIIKWEDNKIVLDNNIEISIEETEQDCCACAYGQFEDVILDAAITNVSDIEYEPWENEYGGGEYGCKATVTIMHNRNVICKAVGNADAGNGGYYYSIASFVIHVPNDDKVEYCYFVSNGGGEEED